jgi:hypothetical protein
VKYITKEAKRNYEEEITLSSILEESTYDISRYPPLVRN